MTTNPFNTVLRTAAAASIVLLSSCQHKELCYNHLHTTPVDIVFDWRNAPGAEPDGMLLYFFPEEGGAPVKFALGGHEGGRIEIPDGTYKVICVNSDSETAQFRGTDSFGTFEIFTREASVLEGLKINAPTKGPIVEGTEDQAVSLTPDMIYGGTLTGATVPFGREPVTLTMYPDKVVKDYSFEILDVENMEYATTTGASLSGMSGSYMAGEECCSPGLHTVPFEAVQSGTDRLEGSFHVFGHCPDDAASAQHIFALYVIRSDGKQIYYTFDVTQQVHDAPDQDNVHIVIQGLTLPKPIEGGGGMNPSVDGWEDGDIFDIPM